MRLASSCLVLAFLLVPTVARADDHRMDLFGGYSGGNGGSTTNGVHQSIAWGFQPKLPRLTWVVADFSTQSAKHGDGTRVTQVIAATGLRVTGIKGTHHHKPFFHFLVGNAYTNDGQPDANNPATLLGFGYEFVHAPTDPKKGLAVRVQGDRVFMAGAREDFWRWSVGILYRFGQHPHPPK